MFEGQQLHACKWLSFSSYMFNSRWYPTWLLSGTNEVVTIMQAIILILLSTAL